MSTAKKHFPATGKENSSFAMTCNRLSLFLKEKGRLRDLGIDENFDIKGKAEIRSPATEKTTATVDLLSTVETTAKAVESINHLPQYVSLESFNKPDDSTNKAFSGEAVASTECKTAQMTIFYRGQVLVFDDVSADKARDLMLAATGASSSNDNNNNNNNRIQNRIQSASTSISPCEAFDSQVDGSDLPIARRASLHRFLAKRKDRATVRAPYQLQNPLMVSASLNYNFDLNL